MAKINIGLVSVVTVLLIVGDKGFRLSGGIPQADNLNEIHFRITLLKLCDDFSFGRLASKADSCLIKIASVCVRLRLAADIRFPISFFLVVHYLLIFLVVSGPCVLQWLKGKFMVSANVIVIIPMHLDHPVHGSVGVEVGNDCASLGMVAVVLNSCALFHVVHLC